MNDGRRSPLLSIERQFAKVRVLLFRINGVNLRFKTSTSNLNHVAEMSVPGWDFHELKGDRKGTWSVKVTGNYRLTFKFVAGKALDVDLEDYH